MSSQYCVSCGHPNASQSNFCSGCGKSLKDDTASVSQIIASINIARPTREQQQRRPAPVDYDRYDPEEESAVINVPKSLDMEIQVFGNNSEKIENLIQSQKTGFSRDLPKLTKKAAKAKLGELLEKQKGITRHNVGGETE